MNRNRSIHRLMVVGAIIGISLAPFQFWPFTLVFLILGAIATGVITALTGYVINYLLVLFIEYIILMLLILSIVFYVVYGGRTKTKI